VTPSAAPLGAIFATATIPVPAPGSEHCTLSAPIGLHAGMFYSCRVKQRNEHGRRQP